MGNKQVKVKKKKKTFVRSSCISDRQRGQNDLVRNRQVTNWVQEEVRIR